MSRARETTLTFYNFFDTLRHILMISDGNEEGNK